MEVKEQISRWRLILGQESDKRLSTMTDLTLTQKGVFLLTWRNI